MRQEVNDILEKLAASDPRIYLESAADAQIGLLLEWSGGGGIIHERPGPDGLTSYERFLSPDLLSRKLDDKEQREIAKHLAELIISSDDRRRGNLFSTLRHGARDIVFEPILKAIQHSWRSLDKQASVQALWALEKFLPYDPSELPEMVRQVKKYDPTAFLQHMSMFEEDDIANNAREASDRVERMLSLG